MRKLLFFLFLSFQLLGQKNTALPRSTPEAEGVSSDDIARFIDAATNSKHEFHSIIIVRHGKVIAENWWSPYRADLKHTMYSCSKSFTATAVGFAVTEKLLTVDDPVIKFFPDEVPTPMPQYLADLKVKDLLSMSVGHDKDPTGPVVISDNWVRTFFKTPILYKPGTKFVYNSAATYMVSAIVQKVTGQKILDYLRPRLFNPLGIEGIDWETSPQDVNVGGWGLRLKTEDMAKFGQLFLQKGVWQGKQILPAAWVEEASTMKIMQDPETPQSKKDSSDWLQGYCYQMWRSRHNSYRGDGANGQFILVLPEHDAVVAITCETPDMQGELNMVWQYILPAFQKKKLSSNAKSSASLKTKASSSALPIPAKSAASSLETSISGRTFGLISSDKTFDNVRFDFKNDVCQMTLKTGANTHTIAFGSGKWAYGETTKYGPYLVARAQNNRVGLPPFKIAGSYTWKDNKTLDLTLRYIESPHTEYIHCTFDGDYVLFDSENIFNKTIQRPISKAVLRKNNTNPPRLIVRGDDMGYAHSGNQALMKCATEGVQTSIEVIVPSPWFPEAVKMLEQNKSIDVGLHFAITSEWDNIRWRPLSNCPSLRDKDGYFYQMLFPNAHYPKQAVMDNAWTLDDYEKELRAQIEMAKKYIPQLSHISGHMGSTMFSEEARERAKKVAKEYNLKLVDTGAPDDLQISYINFDFQNKTTEERIEGFIKMLDKLEDGKTYVYVEHPGLDNEELRAIYHIGYMDVAKGRQDVTMMFTSEKVKEAIQRKGIQLVSYKDIIESKMK